MALTDPIEEHIPVEKTRITLVQSMDIPGSTVNGNISTIQKIPEQTGVAELNKEEDTININPYIILFHRDLGTNKQIQTAK